ncbi:hypothetical protein DNTS_005583 [Danionella cerebrum]|uniref:C2H2-type domain-containing protein n=1 Tax=Danionella cerebrum TaxID=2873325 RepID=A0A553NJX7_9TELE|nr:hypothetical protein DNTS_005583 [Danionella translucida]
MESEYTLAHLKLLNCSYPECGATFTRQWRLQEHETLHSGERPHKCGVVDCGRSFTRRAHLRRHELVHNGVKNFKCTAVDCGETFINADKLRRHQRFKHEDKSNYFKCKEPRCSKTFRKRRELKLHLATHGISSFRCSKVRCGMSFDSRIARAAHERKHAGYRCTNAECHVTAATWGRLQKHRRSHPVSYTCTACKKVFNKPFAMRRHKRTHALQKPVLLCPSQGCQAYFSTTFNLQHHIRKVHLKLLSHCCYFPDCNKSFAMRESLLRHMLLHEPDAAKHKLPHKKRNRIWQKRLEGRNRSPLIEDFHNLFSLRMNISPKPKLEADLNGLFNERKIPHYIDLEVNLRDLFSTKAVVEKINT